MSNLLNRVESELRALTRSREYLTNLVRRAKARPACWPESPERAGEVLVAAARANAQKRQADRQIAVQRAAARLREFDMVQAK